MRFRFGALVHWADGLGAKLIPDDAESAEALSVFAEKRSELSECYKEVFGIAPYEAYEPHVSLGYFANAQIAEGTGAFIESWDNVMRKKMDGLVLQLETISLYGFTDMATFFKCV